MDVQQNPGTEYFNPTISVTRNSTLYGTGWKHSAAHNLSQHQNGRANNLYPCPISTSLCYIHQSDYRFDNNNNDSLLHIFAFKNEMQCVYTGNKKKY